MDIELSLADKKMIVRYRQYQAALKMVVRCAVGSGEYGKYLLFWWLCHQVFVGSDCQEDVLNLFFAGFTVSSS